MFMSSELGCSGRSRSEISRRTLRARKPHPYVPAAAGRRARWNQGEEIITVNLFDFCSSPRAQPSLDTSNHPRPLALPPSLPQPPPCIYVYTYINIYIIFKEEKLLFPLPVAGFH